jgi:hypothetical protein
MEVEMEAFHLEDWYNPTQAAERLAANSGRHVDISYVRTLARYNKIRSYPLSDRIRLYRKEDVDSYLVETRGAKSGRAKRLSAQRHKEAPV